MCSDLMCLFSGVKVVKKCAGGWDSVLDPTEGAYSASRPLPGLRRRGGKGT